MIEMSDSIAKGYSTIAELPSQVRSSFDEHDQQKWLETYNSLVGDSSDDDAIEQARIGAWKALINAPSSLAVETWASVEVKDADGEVVPIKSIEATSDRFIKNGGLMHDSHTNVPIGTAWAWEERYNEEAKEPGIVYYFNVYRDSPTFEHARDDILSGRKRSVSIGAEAPRGGYKCDERGCYVERDVTDLYEISICETPANPLAGFIAVGDEIAKSKHEGIILKMRIGEMDVHQDYTTCPYQRIKHELQKAVPTAEVHIVGNMVIAKSKRDESKVLDCLYEQGVPFRYDLMAKAFEAFPEYGPGDAKEEALSNEWACTDAVGHIMLTRQIPEEVFKDWFEKGLIAKVGDVWCIRDSDVAKDGGSMGVGDAGAYNAVYSGNRKVKDNAKSVAGLNSASAPPQSVGKSDHKRCPPGYHYNRNKGGCYDADGNPAPQKAEDAPQAKTKEDLAPSYPADFDSMSNKDKLAYIVAHPLKSIIDAGNGFKPVSGSFKAEAMKYTKDLSDDDRQAINAYTGNAFIAINKALYGKEPLSDTENGTIYRRDGLKYIKELDTVIANAVIPEPVRVYRAARANLMFDGDSVEDAIGNEYEYNGFVSTSANMGTVTKLVKGKSDATVVYGKGKEPDMLFEMEVPAGQGVGVYIAEASQMPQERELLIRRGAKFKVIKYDKDRNMTLLRMVA